MLSRVSIEPEAVPHKSCRRSKSLRSGYSWYWSQKQGTCPLLVYVWQVLQVSLLTSGSVCKVCQQGSLLGSFVAFHLLWTKTCAGAAVRAKPWGERLWPRSLSSQWDRKPDSAIHFNLHTRFCSFQNKDFSHVGYLLTSSVRFQIKFVQPCKGECSAWKVFMGSHVHMKYVFTQKLRLFFAN